jgi:hypothetical protein
MANKVLLKKSSTAAKVPLTTDLDYGELALNYTDGKLYYKTAANAVDVYASITATATLTNKTLTTPVIAQINAASGLATLKLATIASAVNEVTIENSIAGQPPHIYATGSDTNISLHLSPKGTSRVVIMDGTDATKRLAFGVGGATTNTVLTFEGVQTVNRTITFPDATDTLVGKATTDTLTNKTLTSPVMTGTPTAPTAADNTVTTQVATTAFADTVALNKAVAMAIALG